MNETILPLDPSKRSTDTIDFQTALQGKIVGQEEGVQALVDLYQVFRAGLNSPGRPVGNLLFLGRPALEDPHRGSGRRDPLWRRPFDHQNRLRRISALLMKLPS